jgi:hypothetical protein
VRLVAVPAWLAGTLALLGGYVFQAIALDHGRLAVIQPLLVTTVVFALPPFRSPATASPSTPARTRRRRRRGHGGRRRQAVRVRRPVGRVVQERLDGQGVA